MTSLRLTRGLYKEQNYVGEGREHENESRQYLAMGQVVTISC